MPYLKENPQLWYIEITYGSGAHHNSLKAMKLRANGKCLSVKDEGDTSHVNQAYDRFVAKGDKKQAANSLNFLRSACYSIGTVIDQWIMVHVVF